MAIRVGPPASMPRPSTSGHVPQGSWPTPPPPQPQAPLPGGMVPDWMFSAAPGSWPTPPPPQDPLMGGLVPDSMFGGGAPNPVQAGGIPTPTPSPGAPDQQRTLLAALMPKPPRGNPMQSQHAEAANYTTSGTDRSKGAGMGSSARSNKGGGLY